MKIGFLYKPSEHTLEILQAELPPDIDFYSLEDFKIDMDSLVEQAIEGAEVT